MLPVRCVKILVRVSWLWKEFCEGGGLAIVVLVAYVDHAVICGEFRELLAAGAAAGGEQIAVGDD